MCAVQSKPEFSQNRKLRFILLIITLTVNYTQNNLQAYKFRHSFKEEQFNYMLFEELLVTLVQMLHFIFTTIY